MLLKKNAPSAETLTPAGDKKRSPRGRLSALRPPSNRLLAALTAAVLLLCVGAAAAYAGWAGKEARALRGELSRTTSRLAELEKRESEARQALADKQAEAESLAGEVDSLQKELASAPLPEGVKTAYLTFDDGPSPNTLRVLEVLKQKKVRATFFVVHSSHPQYLKNIADDGHAIGLHTYSHDYATVYRSQDAFFEDLGKISDEVEEYTGLTSRILRFPGGSSNTASRRYAKGIMSALTKEVERRGYRYFDWNCSSGDASSKTYTPEQILENVRQTINTSASVCILMHDSAAKTTTPEALPLIIDYLKSEGYAFSTLDVGSPVFHHPVNN